MREIFQRYHLNIHTNKHIEIPPYIISVYICTWVLVHAWWWVNVFHFLASSKSGDCIVNQQPGRRRATSPDISNLSYTSGGHLVTCCSLKTKIGPDTVKYCSSRKKEYGVLASP